MEKITTNYSKVFSETYEIFKYLPKDFLEKIPKQLIDVVSDNRDMDYVFEYDTNKKLEEQDIYEETKEFISSLYLTYYCDDNKKEEILSIMKDNTEKREKELREKYNPDKIFENKNEIEKTEKIEEEKIKETENQEENSLVIKKESLVVRVINKIKEIFGLK